MLLPVVPAAILSAWFVLGRSQVAGGVWLALTTAIVGVAGWMAFEFLSVPLHFGAKIWEVTPFTDLALMTCGLPWLIWLPTGWLVWRGVLAAAILRKTPPGQTPNVVADTFS
jgi:hypothetical protein